MYTVKDEIVKWLVNEHYIQKAGDVKKMSYAKLLEKYMLHANKGSN